MNKKILGLTLFGLLSTACITGTATIRSQDQFGGVLVLNGPEGDAMKAAQKRMDLHCGAGNSQVIRRETVKVGTENYSEQNTQYDEQTDTARDSDSAQVEHQSVGHSDSAQSTREDESSQTSGGSSTQGVSGTRDVNEIRVTYQCGGAASPAPVPVGPAPVPVSAPPAQVVPVQGAAPQPPIPAPPTSGIPVGPAPAP